MPIRGQSGQNLVRACGTEPISTSIIVWSRITAASRGDVDRCSASRASHRPNDIAVATTNSGTFCAADPACASTFQPLRVASTICVESQWLSVSWKPLDRHRLRTLRTQLNAQARALTEPQLPKCLLPKALTSGDL